MRTFIEEKGGRKFAMVVVISAVAQANLMFGLVTAELWAQLMGGVLLIYVGGNVAQKFVTGDRYEYHDERTGPTVPRDRQEHEASVERLLP